MFGDGFLGGTSPFGADLNLLVQLAVGLARHGGGRGEPPPLTQSPGLTAPGADGILPPGGISP